MSNKQVIAIFLTGVCLLLAAFWAGLSIARHATREPAGAGVGAKNGTPSPGPGSNAADQKGAPRSPAAAEKDDDPNARFIVHVATFGTAEQADQLTRELRRKYLSADTQQPGQGGDTLYRVNIGPYKNRADADRVARELQAEGRKGIMVLPQAANNHP